MIPWWATDFTEADIARVAGAIRARCISQGRYTRDLEERLGERLGVPYVICTSSGTTALTMSLMAAGVGLGDEVMLPDRTWIATAHAVLMTGARVRLSDVDARGLMYADGVSAALAQEDGAVINTCKATIPVNLNGRYVNLEGLSGTIIEDSCQAFPKPPAGLAACYSMSTAKLLPTGQGGFIATRDEGFARECRTLRTHDVADAMVPQVLQWKRFGYNFRLTDLQAALGLSQLATLDARIERLHEIRALYRLLGVSPLPCDGVPLYTEVLCPTPESLRAYLRGHSIDARPNYPSLHTASYLRAYGRFPNAERFSDGLTLPSGPGQSDANIRYVCEILNAFKIRPHSPAAPSLLCP